MPEPEPPQVPPHRAQPPRPPRPTPELERARGLDNLYREDREAAARRSLVRGLAVVALIVLLLGMARAGLDRVFVSGWWHQW